MKLIADVKPKQTVAWELVSAIVLALVLLLALFIPGKKYFRKEEVLESERLRAPEFSFATGFYTDNLSLALRTTEPGATIYYTTDGSEPGTGSVKYTGPISIKNRAADDNVLSAIPTSPVWKAPAGKVFKGTLIKAITVKGAYRSRIAANTYFVDRKGRAKYLLPVMILTINPDDFFGFKKGIYIRGRTFEDKNYYIKTNKPLNETRWWYYPSNYTRRGAEWERNVQINYLEQGSNNGPEARAGIRIHGNATRAYGQKSLKIHFRSQYGDSVLNYDFFHQKGTLPLRSFLLRNSGQDLNSTMFRDAFEQSLLEDINIDKQASQPCILFINGEYWGIHNITERLDEDYLCLKYHIPLDSFSIAEPSGAVHFGHEEDGRAYTALIKYITANDLANPVHYKYVTDRIDIKNIIDYLIAEIYFANEDWPHNNIEMWRYHTNKLSDSLSVRDGRWRWVIFDLDAGFGHKYSVSEQSLNYVLHTQALGPLFGSLLKSPEFRSAFFSRYEYHINHTFDAAKVTDRIGEMQAVIMPEIPEHLSRWRTMTVNEWKNSVNQMRRFARERPAHQLKELRLLRKKLEGNL